MIFIGIDPGLDGAIAAITSKGTLLGVWDTPTAKVTIGTKTKKGNKRVKRVYLISAMVDLLEKYKDRRVVVYIEYVRAMPGQGVTSMFSMGHGLGVWDGIIGALRMSTESVTPVKWRRTMLGPNAGKGKGANMIAASRLVPKASKYITKKKHDGRADAILIAEYARRIVNI